MRRRDFQRNLDKELSGKVDSQQFRLYETESKMAHGQKFSLDELQDYVDGIVGTEWWAEQYEYTGRVFVEQINDNGNEGSIRIETKDGSKSFTICLPKHMMSQLTVAHELSHVILANYDCGHDPRFMRTYINLIYRTMGAEAYTEALNRFKAAGIEIG